MCKNEMVKDSMKMWMLIADGMGKRDKAGQDIGGQGQEGVVQEGDQSDQSVLTGVSGPRWWEGRGQDQGGLVQRGEASHGGEGEIQASIEAREVSVLEKVLAKFVPKLTKNKMGEGEDKFKMVRFRGRD